MAQNWTIVKLKMDLLDYKNDTNGFYLKAEMDYKNSPSGSCQVAKLYCIVRTNSTLAPIVSKK
jgi:hypothetical protein